MNPAANGSISGGLAGAAVIMINYALSLVNVAPMPSKVQTALAILVTAGVSYYLHIKTKPKTPKPAGAAQ